MRVESLKPANNGGWVHEIGRDGWRNQPSEENSSRRASASDPATNWGRLVKVGVAATSDACLRELAQDLNLKGIDELRRLRVFWHEEFKTKAGREYAGWGFPMMPRVGGPVTGIRVRRPDGYKLSATGSRDGLFIPEGLELDGQPVFLAEGASDTLAGLQIGLPTIGRPSCRGAARITADVCRGRHVVIVSDADDDGRKGARALAAEIYSECTSVRIIEPPSPHGDLRAWVCSGATATDVEDLIGQAEPWRTGTGRENGHPAWPRPEPLRSFDELSAPEFDLDAAFPPSLNALRDYIASVSTAMQTPQDLSFALLLSVGGAAASGKFEIVPSPDHREVMGLWTLTLMASGERKSPVFTEMLMPVHEWERRRSEELAPEHRAYRDAMELREATRKKLLNKAARGDKKAQRDLDALAKKVPPIKPPIADFVTSDVTAEAMGRLLAENGERALLASDEPDALDVILGRYSRGRPNLDVWNKGYSGSAVKVHRIGREPIHLLRPVVSVAITGQPEGMGEILGHKLAAARGFLPRFLKFMPRSLVGRRRVDPPSISPGLRTEYQHRILRLLNAAPPSNSRNAEVIQLEHDARNLFCEFMRHVESELGEDGDLSGVQAWANKLAGNVARIAGLFHLLEHGPTTAPIPAPTMEAAIAFGADYLIDSELYVMRTGMVDFDMYTAGRILKWIHAKDPRTFSRRDLHNALKPKGRMSVDRIDDINRSLQILVDAWWIHPIDEPVGRGYGTVPSAAHYRVHPEFKRHYQETSVGS